MSHLTIETRETTIGAFTFKHEIECDIYYDLASEGHDGEWAKEVGEYTLDRVYGYLWGESITETREVPITELIDHDSGNSWISDEDENENFAKFWPELWHISEDVSYLEFDSWIEDDTAYFECTGYKLIGGVATAWERGTYEFVTFPFIEWGSPQDTWIEQAQHFENFYRQDWCYTVAITTMYHDDLEIASDALGGVESDSGDYFDELFKEQIDICLSQAPDAVAAEIQNCRDTITKLEKALRDIPAKAKN